MIAIETEHGRFEAETMRAAQALARKAERAAKKQSAERDASYQRAQTKARANGYRILERAASGEAFPRGWTYYATGKKWAENLFQPMNESADRATSAHALNTEDGQVTLDHYGNEFVGAACNGSGFCWVVFLRERPWDSAASERPVICYAIGVDGDTVALAECPGITTAHFHVTE